MTHIAAIVGCIICTFAVTVEGYPQFYYMVPAPPQQTPASTYYSTPFGPNPSYSFANPATSFVSNSFGPSQAYYTTHQTFGSLGGAAPPIGYHTFGGHSANGIVQPQPAAQHPGSVFAQIPTTTVFSTGQTDQYRGFAYHTQSTNGASANVFFLTGPEAHQLGNLPNFMTKTGQNNTGNQSIAKAKSLASNTVDANATDKNQQEQIVETLNGPPQGPAFDLIRSIFENPQNGFQHFYSSNGQLFSKSIENQNYPASTVLLPAPISIQTFGNFGINPRFSPVENNTKTNGTSEKPEDKGEEVAESMIADVKVKPHDDLATVESSTATTSNETIAQSTETVSSSTEASKEDATTKENAPTVKEARSIKQETSTAKEEPSSTIKIESISSSTTENPTTEVSSTTKAA